MSLINNLSTKTIVLTLVYLTDGIFDGASRCFNFKTPTINLIKAFVIGNILVSLQFKFESEPYQWYSFFGKVD